MAFGIPSQSRCAAGVRWGGVWGLGVPLGVPEVSRGVEIMPLASPGERDLRPWRPWRSCLSKSSRAPEVTVADGGKFCRLFRRPLDDELGAGVEDLGPACLLPDRAADGDLDFRRDLERDFFDPDPDVAAGGSC